MTSKKRTPLATLAVVDAFHFSHRPMGRITRHGVVNEKMQRPVLGGVESKDGNHFLADGAMVGCEGSGPRRQGGCFYYSKPPRSENMVDIPDIPSAISSTKIRCLIVSSIHRSKRTRFGRVSFFKRF